MNYMVIRSIFWFVLAGLMEIGGGYLMWLWLREKKSWYVGLAGALVLVGYGIVPTFQPAHFGRTPRMAASSLRWRCCGAGTWKASGLIAGMRLARCSV